MDFRDYYATLGVAKTATGKEIKQAYRRLARKHHPDVNPGDRSAESKFKEVNEAYEVLGTPETRKKYDELGANWRQYEQAGQQRQRAQPQQDDLEYYLSRNPHRYLFPFAAVRRGAVTCPGTVRQTSCPCNSSSCPFVPLAASWQAFSNAFKDSLPAILESRSA